ATGGAASAGGRTGDPPAGGGSGEGQLGRLYAALATGCGYGYRDIDAMTLAEAGEIFAYWAENPPPHLLLQAIARLLGWAPGSTATPAQSAAPTSLDDIAAAAPPGLAILRGADPGLPAPVLDPDLLRARSRLRA